MVTGGVQVNESRSRGLVRVRASGSVCASSVSFLRPRTTVTNSGPGLTGRLERPSGLKEGALDTKRASRRHKRLRHQTHRRRPTRLRRQTRLGHQIHLRLHKYYPQTPQAPSNIHRHQTHQAPKAPPTLKQKMGFVFLMSGSY